MIAIEHAGSPPSPDLASASALELASRIRRRDLSSVELTRHCLQVVARKNRDVSAFVELDERRALRAAEQADVRVARGGELPILLGIPSGIKDHEHMRWMRTRAGSRALSWVVSPIDSALAKACRFGGLVLLGKLATSELTILPFVHTDVHPPTRNPLALDYYAGGSSGGSAAAVASGMLPIAPGSDGAGSIRIPASFCGLVGFKPGRGTVFHEHEVTDPMEISAVGPLARNVRDAAALLDLLTGRRLHVDPYPAGSFLAACSEPPQGLRIHFGVRTPLAGVEPEIEAVVRHAARTLEGVGHRVEEGGAIDASVDEFLPLMAKMVRAVPIPPFVESMLQPTTRWLRERGRGISRSDLRRTVQILSDRVLAWFGDADAWLLPTSPVLPPKVGCYADLGGEAVFRAIAATGAFTAAFNVSGQPAVSLPAGRSNAGLPIGVQLVGRRGADRRLVALAAALERALA
jgi:amidase